MMERRKWTLMFFFASDNALSPSMLSQLKALKTAGFQKDVNVLVHFDPNASGAPTRFFEINKNEKKLTDTQIGDGTEPFVSDLAGDNITADVINATYSFDEARQFATGLSKTSELEAGPSLSNFIEFCRMAYPAEHFMLFLVGHGMVVGHDTFLPDENPVSAIGLKELGNILRSFSGKLMASGSTLELIAMHSCSMSSIEVVYELKGTASYLLASQGVSFIGAWPYRQFLIKLYQEIEAAGKAEVGVHNVVTEMHRLCIYSSADFIFAGYSADLCLAQLTTEAVRKLNEPLKRLAESLKDALGDEGCRQLILLSHLKSQSYWQETYTDLYDFCYCLGALCTNVQDQNQKALKNACDQVMTALRLAPDCMPHDGPVVCCDYFGPDCQYSHGLSIYFPWASPIEASVIDKYQEYVFTQEFQEHSWWLFLKSYFDQTLRKSRVSEERVTNDTPDPTFDVAFRTASSSFTVSGTMGGAGRLASTALEPIKISPPDSGSGECSCLSIKNYPRDFAISPGTLTLFKPPSSTSATGTTR
jgi:cysteine peptidase C11 family protein